MITLGPINESASIGKQETDGSKTGLAFTRKTAEMRSPLTTGDQLMVRCTRYICSTVLALTVTPFAVAEDKLIPDADVWGSQPIVTPATKEKSPELLPFRSWQLQQGDERKFKQVIDRAAEYGINNIQLSHAIIRTVKDYDKGPHKRFRETIAYANERGISVHIWVQELDGIPGEVRREEHWFDKQPFWDHLEKRYNNVFEGMKGLDGLVIRFAEVEMSPLSLNDKASKLPRAERVAKLVNFLHGICKKHDAQLVVRTFAHSRGSVKTLVEAFKHIDPEVIAMSKDTPHDFINFFPHNLAFGRFGDRMHVAEFDPGGEYVGVGRIAYLNPEYIHMRMKYQRDRHVDGYVLRIERRGRGPVALKGMKPRRKKDVITHDGLNELNLYAFKCFGESTKATPEQIWDEYVTKHVGAGEHVDYVIQALKLTDDITNRCVFMLGTWFADHGKLPGRGDEYHNSRIPRIKSWNADYADVVARLMKPDARTVGEVFTESKEAVFLAKAGRELIEHAKNAGLSEKYYFYYRDQFDDLIQWAEAWQKHRNDYIARRAGGKQPTYDGDFPAGGPPRIDKNISTDDIIKDIEQRQRP